jgi:hypothetical protein
VTDSRPVVAAQHDIHAFLSAACRDLGHALEEDYDVAELSRILIHKNGDRTDTLTYDGSSDHWPRRANQWLAGVHGWRPYRVGS